MADGIKLVEYIFLLWPFGTIPGHGFILRAFAITPSGCTTLGRPPLNKWSAWCRDHYLTRSNIKKDGLPWLRRVSNPQSLQARGRRPTRAATGIGSIILVYFIFHHNLLVSDTDYMYMSMDLIGKCKLSLHICSSDLEHTLFF